MQGCPTEQMGKPVTSPRPKTRPERRRARPILVVDDDPSIRQLVGDVLEEAGYDVLLAADGAQALSVLADASPSLLLLDIQMPGVDGPALARELRMRLRQIPLVVMTGLARPEREADRCNAIACLPKPFDTDALMQVVRRFSR